jgi:hypothetical protein
MAQKRLSETDGEKSANAFPHPIFNVAQRLCLTKVRDDRYLVLFGLNMRQNPANCPMLTVDKHLCNFPDKASMLLIYNEESA